MSRLRRYYSKNNTYFVTSVTYARRPILLEHADLISAAINATKKRVDFDLIAWVVLPDHIHLVLDPLTSDLSGILKRIKQSFSMNYRKRTGYSGRVWQLRFWDHIIRNQDDMNTHLDYTHYNPVKHGLVDDPLRYPHSSIHRFAREGYYQPGWGVQKKLIFESEYGE